jgi:hypothetical protein
MNKFFLKTESEPPFRWVPIAIGRGAKNRNKKLILSTVSELSKHANGS